MVLTLPHSFIFPIAVAFQTLQFIYNQTRVFLAMPTWPKNIHSFMAFAVISFSVFFMSHTQIRTETPDNCDMVWMYESYATLGDFTSGYSRMGSKYRLLYYREGNGIDVDTRPRGIPVLFIPGNAGSYRQARSLASYCSTTSHENSSLPTFDFFTADFNEDFTAFHGGTLLDQAEYLNDAIRYILGLYSSSDEFPPPSSIIIVGHSMGGIVARTLLTLPNYLENSINTIITLSTPHVLPPLSFDRDLVLIYDKINQFWRYESAHSVSRTSPIKNMALISITGGKSDQMVPADLTSVSSLIHPAHGFTTFTYSIPGVWTGIDHLAIVWCRQLRDKLGETLYSIVDSTSSTKTLALKDRMKVFENSLLSEFEFYIRSYESHEVSKMRGFIEEDSEFSKEPKSLFPITHNITIRSSHLKTVSNSLSLPSLGSRKSGEKSLHLMSASSTYIGIMTNTTELESLTILLCESPSGELVNAQNLHVNDYGVSKKMLRCSDIKEHSHVRMPASLATSSHPSADYGEKDNMQFFFFDPKYDTNFNGTLLVVYDGNHTDSSSFMTAGPISMDFMTINSTFSDFFWKNIKLTLSASLYQDISLQIADTSLLSYKVRLETADSRCSFEKSSFSPVVRQYIMDPLESRYHVNANNRDIRIHSYGPRAPYMPYLPASPGDNLHLQIFSPPVNCPENVKNDNITVAISLDIWGSISNIAMRYRTLLVTFPYAVTLLVIAVQLRSFNVHNANPSFENAAANFCNFYLLYWIFGLVAIYFSLGSTSARSLVRKFGLQDDPENTLSLTFFNQFMKHNDLFLGTSDDRFWFLGPLFFIISIGLVALLEAVIRLLSFCLSGLYRRIGGSNHENQKKAMHSNSIGPVAWSSVALFSPVLYFVPFQVTCIFLTITHLVYTLPRAYSQSTDGSSNGNYYNFCVSVCMLFIWQSALNGPFLIVWLHNLSWKWTLAFSTVRNIIAIVPQCLLIILLSWTNFVPRQKKKRSALFTRCILLYMALYSVLCGFTNAYVMHHLLCILSLWFLAIYGDNYRADRSSKRYETLYDNLL